MTLDLRSRAPAHSTPIRRTGIVATIISAIATIRVKMEVSRALKRYRAPRGSPSIPAHLRRDLGLLPESEQLPRRDHQ